MASLFLARACEIACAAFERAMPTIYIGKRNSSTDLLRIPLQSHRIPEGFLCRTNIRRGYSK